MRDYNYYFYNKSEIPFEEGIFTAESLKDAYHKVCERCREVRRDEEIKFSKVTLKRGNVVFDLSRFFSNTRP